jgi:hypothetical protein
MSKITLKETTMGSCNHYPGTGINPGHNQQQIIRQEINTVEKPVISRLINSIHYFIDTCFIMDLSGNAHKKDRYRLLAFDERENRIFVDKYFSTLRGARIGFTKQFKNMSFKDVVSANWSDLYPPDRDWLEEMLSIVENVKSN